MSRHKLLHCPFPIPFQIVNRDCLVLFSDQRFSGQRTAVSCWTVIFKRCVEAEQAC